MHFAALALKSYSEGLSGGNPTPSVLITKNWSIKLQYLAYALEQIYPNFNQKSLKKKKSSLNVFFLQKYINLFNTISQQVVHKTKLIFTENRRLDIIKCVVKI